MKIELEIKIMKSEKRVFSIFKILLISLLFFRTVVFANYIPYKVIGGYTDPDMHIDSMTNELLDYSYDGKYLISYNNSELFIFNSSSMNLIKKIDLNGYGYYDAILHPKKHYIIFYEKKLNSGKLIVYNYIKGKKIKTIYLKNSKLSKYSIISINKKGNILALFKYNYKKDGDLGKSELVLLNLNTNKIIKVYNTNHSYIDSGSFIDNKTLLTINQAANKEKKYYIFLQDLKRKILLKKGNYSSRFAILALNKDRYIYSGDNQNIVECKIKSKKCKSIEHFKFTLGLPIKRDQKGRYILFAGTDFPNEDTVVSKLKLYDSYKEKIILDLHKIIDYSNTKELAFYAISPDAKRIAMNNWSDKSIIEYKLDFNHKKSKSTLQNKSNTIYNGWIGYVTSVNNYKEPNEKANNFIKNGRMYLAPNFSEKSYYWTNFDLMRPDLFKNTSGDNFTIETRIKNSESEGGISAYDTRIKILGTKSNIVLTMMGNNYGLDWDYVSVANSTKRELPELVQDFSNWRKIKIKVKNHMLSIYIDNNLIYSMPYVGSVGSITGLHFDFKGSGSVDWIKLYNSNKKLVYHEDF